jgi:hypothetical protein
MSLDNDLKLKHDALDIIKGKRRREYARNIFVSFVPIILSYIVLTYLGLSSSLSLFFLLTLIGSFIISLIYTYSTLPRIWSPLKPMEKAFEDLYESLAKTWPTILQTRELTPDETLIVNYIRDRLQNAANRLGDDWSEEALADEIRDLLDRTKKNIEDRLMDALDTHQLSPSTVVDLAKVFGSPSFDSLRAINSTIEGLHQVPIEESTVSPITQQLTELRKRGLVGVLISIALGFGTAGLILPVIALFLQESPFTFPQKHVDALVGAGALLSALYVQVFRKSTKDP